MSAVLRSDSRQFAPNSLEIERFSKSLYHVFFAGEHKVDRVCCLALGVYPKMAFVGWEKARVFTRRERCRTRGKCREKVEKVTHLDPLRMSVAFRDFSDSGAGRDNQVVMKRTTFA